MNDRYCAGRGFTGQPLDKAAAADDLLPVLVSL